MNSCTEHAIIGIDGGGTKTVCVLAIGSRIASVGVSGPANVCTHPDSAADSVRSAIQDACRAAGSAGRIAAACVGVAGFFACGDPRGPQALLAPAVDADRVRVISDMEAGFLGATLGRPGVVLVAGTGSAAYGGRADGRRARASGWGYLLADEGSAFWIGLEAVKAALRDFDGRGGATALTPRLIERLDVADASQIEGAIYGQPHLSTGVASLAPLVLEAARDGDATAAAILDEAGRHLADAATAVLRRLDLLADRVPVVTVGGVLRDRGGPVFQALRSALACSANHAILSEPVLPPVGGALLQAWRDAQADDGENGPQPAATSRHPDSSQEPVLVRAWAEGLAGRVAS